MDTSTTPARPTAGSVAHGAPFQVDLRLTEGYAFEVDPLQPGAGKFLIDEPPPVGAGRGPGPTRVLASAVAGCLGASLLFAMRKLRIDVKDLTVTALGSLHRNERGRLRVAAIEVELFPVIPEVDAERLPRAVEIFEDYCVVTQSVRTAIDVRVKVTPTTV